MKHRMTRAAGPKKPRRLSRREIDERIENGRKKRAARAAELVAQGISQEVAEIMALDDTITREFAERAVEEERMLEARGIPL